MILGIFNSFSSLLWAFFSFIVLYILYKYILKTYLGLRYYEKQGAIMIFHKKMINVFDNYKNAREKGDFYYRYKELARQHPEARCFVENFGNKILFVPVESEMIKEFLKRYEVYHKARHLLGLTADLIEGSISFTEGIPWKKQRKHMSAAFHYEFLKNVIPMMVEVAQERSESWIKNGDTEHLDVLLQMGTITGEVVGRFFFGQRFSKEKLWGLPLTMAAQQILERLGTEMFTLSNVILGPNFARKGILPRHREINRQIKEFRAKCRGFIEETDKSGASEHNLLNILLEQRKHESPEERLTDETIVGRFVGLFIAGTDTTALTLTSVLYNMSQYPAAYKKVQEEVDREITDLNSFSVDTLNKLEYTTAFIKETLRRGAATGTFFYRVATKDDDLCGVKIKKGTMMNTYLQVPHYNEEHFSDPYEFIPERWLGDHKSGNDGLKADDQAFISFSAGPRSCIGQHFGMIEAKIILGILLKKFEIEFPKDYKLILVQRVTLCPLEPFVIKLKKKDSAKSL